MSDTIKVVRFKGTNAGRTYVGLGITAENCQELKDGKNIVISLADLGITSAPDDVMIYYGETEQQIYDQLKQFMDERTTLRRMSKPRVN